MICALVECDQVKVNAADAEKSQAPFQCPECREAVVLRKGRLKIPHFAHKPPITCDYGRGETEEHRRCKREVFEALAGQPGVQNLELERSMGCVRPDVFAMIREVPVAIEVQLSVLTPERLAQRTREYQRLGVAVLWLAQWTTSLDEARYSPKLWERWVHAAYFGRIYYWRSGLTVTPYKLDEHRLYRPTSEWRNEYGEEMSAGGYERRSKRYRTPKPGRTLHLLEDFRPVRRGVFVSAQFDVPPSLLFMDRYKWSQLAGDHTPG